MFTFPFRFRHQERWHRIDFTVDDSTAAGFLLVADFTHIVEPE